LLLLFEVMDKEWPLWLVLLVFGSVGLVGFLICRKKRVLIALVLPVALLLSIPQVLELNDRFVGPNIVKEAGTRYVVLSCAAMLFAVFFPLYAALFNPQPIRERTEHNETP
jgi:hypothetical protein